MDMDWLYCFVEAAESGSLSKTADKLHRTQPAVGKQIRKLEDALGVQLLKRSASGVAPTEAGVVFLRRVRPLLAAFEAAGREALEAAGELPARIRIGALPSLAASALPPKVLALRADGLDAEIAVEHTSSALAERLREGRIDAALLEAERAPAGLWRRVLRREPYEAVLPAGHALAGRERLSAAEAAAEPLVVYPPGCDVRRHMEEAFGRQGLLMRTAAEAAFGESLLAFVAAGAGIAIVPRTMAERIGGLPLVARPIDDLGAARTVALAARSQAIGRTLLRHLHDL